MPSRSKAFPSQQLYPGQSSVHAPKKATCEGNNFKLITSKQRFCVDASLTESHKEVYLLREKDTRQNHPDHKKFNEEYLFSYPPFKPNHIKTEPNEHKTMRSETTQLILKQIHSAREEGKTESKKDMQWRSNFPSAQKTILHKHLKIHKRSLLFSHSLKLGAC